VNNDDRTMLMLQSSAAAAAANSSSAVKGTPGELTFVCLFLKTVSEFHGDQEVDLHPGSQLICYIPADRCDW